MAVLLADLGDHRAPQFWAYVSDNPGRDRLDVLPAAAYVGHILERTAGHARGLRLHPQGDPCPRRPRARASVRAGPHRARARDPHDRADHRDPRRDHELAGTHRAVRRHARIRTSDHPNEPTGGRRQRRPGRRHPARDVPGAGRGGLSPGHRTRPEWPHPGRFARRVARHRGRWVGRRPGLQLAVRPVRLAGLLLRRAESRRIPTILLRYFARVVTPGTYVWEPAIAPSRSQADKAALTTAGTLTIH